MTTEARNINHLLSEKTRVEAEIGRWILDTYQGRTEADALAIIEAKWIDPDLERMCVGLAYWCDR